MHAFILAGGFATRLWPLTETRAKPLLPIAGKPIVEYLVEKIPAGVPVTISTNAAFQKQFEDWIATLDRKVELLIEDTRHDDHKLGALGATREWIINKKIDDDILLLTGDNYLGFAMEDFLEKYTTDIPLLAAFDIGDKAKASAFGTVILDPNDTKNILMFEEKPKEPKTSIVSTGCCVIPKVHIPLLLDYAERHPDNVGGIFEEFLQKNFRVECFTFTEPWLDIGSFSSYLDAHRLLIGTKTITHDSASLTESETYGCVFIDEKSTVAASNLHDCVIFTDCRIQNCVLRNCVIDEGCQLTNVDLQGKMIRKGTMLERKM
ncbi:MAG: hypothetical protein JWM56_673 [Candidatus Peribacteria bacterium]|nr:hypothetical protein [Candidatus Peribacteria bacterium]